MRLWYGLLTLAFLGLTYFYFNHHLDMLDRKPLGFPYWFKVLHWVLIFSLFLGAVIFASRMLAGSGGKSWTDDIFWPIMVICVVGPLVDAMFAPAILQKQSGTRDLITSETEVRYELHEMFSQCRKYWAKAGADKSCDMAVVTQPQYGFVPDQGVTIDGSGNAENFSATARHRDSTQIWAIDHQGVLTIKQG